MASLRPRGMLALFGVASGPVPPMDTQRLNTAGSVFLTKPKLQDYVATRKELTWRAGEVLAAVREGSLQITIGGRYPLAGAARAHQDLQGRHTTGKLLLLPKHPVIEKSASPLLHAADVFPGVGVAQLAGVELLHAQYGQVRIYRIGFACIRGWLRRVGRCR